MAVGKRAPCLIRIKVTTSSSRCGCALHGILLHRTIASIMPVTTSMPLPICSGPHVVSLEITSLLMKRLRASTTSRLAVSVHCFNKSRSMALAFDLPVALLTTSAFWTTSSWPKHRQRDLCFVRLLTAAIVPQRQSRPDKLIAWLNAGGPNDAFSTRCSELDHFRCAILQLRKADVCRGVQLPAKLLFLLGVNGNHSWSHGVGLAHLQRLRSQPFDRMRRHWCFESRVRRQPDAHNQASLHIGNAVDSDMTMSNIHQRDVRGTHLTVCSEEITSSTSKATWVLKP